MLLELGGKAPLIVLDDADLDEAAKAAAFGAFMNSGQICMSTERIIVVDSVADAFVAKFRNKVDTMPVGDPREGKAPLGAVVDQNTVDHVKRLIVDALGAGAEQINGGEANGVLMPAHVIDKVTPAMKLFRDENFGPVVAIIRATDEDEAIALYLGFDLNSYGGCITWDVVEAIHTPGAIILLCAWKDQDSAVELAKYAMGPEDSRIRVTRVVRDYSMFDRREAPQYFPDAAGRDSVHDWVSEARISERRAPRTIAVRRERSMRRLSRRRTTPGAMVGGPVRRA